MAKEKNFGIERTLSAINRDAVTVYKKATKAPVSKEEKLEEELVGFTQSFQIMLDGNPEYDKLYQDPTELLEHVRDGVLLSLILNKVQPVINMKKVNKTINLANLNKSGSKDVHLCHENLNQIIKAARTVGCKIVNTGAEDVLGKNETITLGLIWQIVRMGLVKDVNLISHPELIRLLHENENLTDLIALTPEQLLLRWMNHHLMRAGVENRVASFQTDLRDSKIYALLLERIAPRKINHDTLAHAMKNEDLGVRAVEIVNQVNAIGCNTFARPVNIISGHKKFNIALVASMFNTHIGIHLPTEDELDALFAQLEMQAAEIAELKQKLAQALKHGDSLERAQAELKESIAELEAKIESLSVAHQKATEVLNEAHAKEVANLKKKAKEAKKDFKVRLNEAHALADKERAQRLAAMAGAEESAEAAEQLRKAEETAKEAERIAKEEEQQAKEALQVELNETRANLREVEAKLEAETADKLEVMRLKDATIEQLHATKESLKLTSDSLSERREYISTLESEVDMMNRKIAAALGENVSGEDEVQGTNRLMALVDQLLKTNKDNERRKHEALSKFAALQTKYEIVLDKIALQSNLKADHDRKNFEDEQAKNQKKKIFGKTGKSNSKEKL